MSKTKQREAHDIMGYSTENFWKQYSDYHGETRGIHARAFELCLDQVIHLDGDISGILDLGMGKFGRTIDLFCEVASPIKQYVGIDQEEVSNIDEFFGSNKEDVLDFTLLQGDYSDLKFISSYMDLFIKFPLAVSLFSSEVVLEDDVRFSLYNELFKKDNLKHAIVSGFYYKGHKDLEWYREKLDDEGFEYITSRQTIEDIGELNGETFKENIRFVFENPSKMFGEDVVEVWRVLERA